MATYSALPDTDFPSENLAKPPIRNPHFWGVMRVVPSSTVSAQKSLDRDFAVARKLGRRL